MDQKHTGSTRNLNRIIAGGFLLLAAICAFAYYSERVGSAADRFTTSSVPVAMLDNGKVGTILKQQGLVYVEDNDQARYASGSDDTGDAPLLVQHPFQRKRRVGDYLYRANQPGKRQLPSTRQVTDGGVQQGQYLLSVAVTDVSLTGPVKGLLANVEDGSRRSEKPVTFSIFTGSRLVDAGSAGIRLFGSGVRRQAPQSAGRQQFELFLRNSYGRVEIAADTLFSDIPRNTARHFLSGLVIKRDNWLVRDFSLSLAELAGLSVPLHKVALFQLNQGPASRALVREPVSSRQWWRKAGTSARADLDFYHSDDDEEDADWRWYREMEDWLDHVAVDMTIRTVATYIDIENLTDSLVLMMFCGSSDWQTWAIYRDRGRYPYWRWVAMDLETCFTDHWRTARGNPARQHWMEVVATWNPQTGQFGNTSHDIRSRLFAGLMNQDPAYRQYFAERMRRFLDKVSGSLKLREHLAAYSTLQADSNSGSMAGVQQPSRQELADFLVKRPPFIRSALKKLEDAYSTTEAAPTNFSD